MAPNRNWILFDLDGTLADSLPALYQAYLDFLASHGITGTLDEFNMLQGSLPDIVSHLKNAYGIDAPQDELERDYHERMRAAYEKHVEPYPDAKKTLEELKKQGYYLGLVTSAKKDLALSFIQKHKWDQLFSLMVFGDEVPKGKPAPNIFYHACHLRGINRDSALVVEDSLSGFQSAVNAGLYCLRVDRKRTKLSDVMSLLNGTLRKDYWQACEIIAIGNIELKSTPGMRALAPAKLARVEQIWLAETARNPKLFNGTVFAYLRHSLQGATTIIEGAFVDYKQFLAQLREPVLDLGIKPVGVSGFTVINDNGKRYAVFALRSDDVTEYPGHLELVPSGSLDISALGPDGTVRFHDKLRDEFSEETGLPASAITSIRSCGLVFDRKDQVYDVCAIIEVNATRQQVLDAFCSVSEYHKPCFVALKDLSKFVEENAHVLVPSSLALARIVSKEVAA
ncbi:MAG: HAD family hydrolase [Candidatus Woesearchaeota archaeon]